MNLSERDDRVIWHPYTRQQDRLPAIPILRGNGAWLEDEQGKRYLDAISSWWVTLHGHAHPYIAEKLYQQALQLEQVIFTRFTHRPAVELAERLLPLLPGSFARIFYSDNGSTAVEVALKMALQYWWNRGEGTKRNKVLCFRHAYHGDTFGAMSVSDRSVFTLAFQDKLFEVLFIDPPDAAHAATYPIPWEEIACFIYEPLLMGAGGMRIYPASELELLLQCCKQNDVLCIADEVLTGFGRTGTLFASERCPTAPDIICLSKGLTGGTLPLGITAASDRVYEAFLSDDHLKTLFHGHSFTANPLSCAAALASLDLLETQASKAAHEELCIAQERFAATLNASRPAANAPYQAKGIRAMGTLVALELEQGEDGYLNKLAPAITAMALERGIYLRPLGNTLYFLPPYCINAAERNKVYQFISELVGA